MSAKSNALQLGFPHQLRLALLDERVPLLKLWNPLQLLLSNLLQVYFVGALRPGLDHDKNIEVDGTHIGISQRS